MARRRISVTRLALTGIIVTVALYAACSVAAVAFDLPATHAFLDLFTDSVVPSTSTLIEGMVGALVLGGFAGALIAAVYNLLGFLDEEPASAPGPSE